jgi:hypothetical protein
VELVRETGEFGDVDVPLRGERHDHVGDVLGVERPPL